MGRRLRGPAALAGLVAALWLAGCAAKQDNAVTIVNRWSKGCTISLREARAAGSQFLDLPAGQTAGFAKLAKGTYDLAFCVDGICKRSSTDSPTATNPNCASCTGAFIDAVARTVTFTGCCDARTFVVQADGGVSE